MAVLGAEATAANASAANATVGWIDDLRPTPGFPETAQLLVFMVALHELFDPHPDSSRDLRPSAMLSRLVGAIMQEGDDTPDFMQLLLEEHSCLLWLGYARLLGRRAPNCIRIIFVITVEP